MRLAIAIRSMQPDSLLHRSIIFVEHTFLEAAHVSSDQIPHIP